MGIKVDFKITGMEELLGNVARVKELASKEAYNAIVEEANTIMEESLTEVPRDTEALAESAFVDTEGSDVTFGYGGKNVKVNPSSGALTEEYMVVVHEDLSAVHDVGKAKFLEDPVNRHKKYIESNVRRKIRSVLSFLR